MKYLLSDIADILQAEARIVNDNTVEHILTDSRKLNDAATTLFFALEGPRRNGRQFISELYNKGVRSFVVTDIKISDDFPEAGFLEVPDVLWALQKLAASHRFQFLIPIIGITGSNGKTIVKEWLYQLLHEELSIVRSPKSYNSQVGVPLSLWQMNGYHKLGIFEAGISEQGKMLRLENMIRPTIGVLTNIGEAHSEGFIDDDHKFREKLAFFRNCKIVIGRAIDFEGRKDMLDMLGDEIRLITWGYNDNADIIIRSLERKDTGTEISIEWKSNSRKVIIPFTDDASIENAMTCYAVLNAIEDDNNNGGYAILASLDFPMDRIIEKMKELHPVNMRLELKKGINHCLVINDSYSADLSSLEIALSFLAQQSGTEKRTVILSDFLQSALDDEELYGRILLALEKYNVKKLIGIGERISAALRNNELTGEKELSISLYPSTEDFLRQFRTSQFKEESILVKGARVFAFENIVRSLQQKLHQTQLEINLNAIVHNLKEYQQLLKPGTKVMAMVKAFAYGSGGAEIAGILQYQEIDWLGVAYADEGVELRKAGIRLPIMVMNPEASSFEAIIDNNLEPEIYSMELLRAFDDHLKKDGIEKWPVHIEIETGMNRLGFSISEMNELSSLLAASPSFKVLSVFSHLAASEDPEQDSFTLEQFKQFEAAASQLEKGLGYPVIKHIANSAAIVRHPSLEMDMVRLGIGLYGVDNTAKLNLQTVATLRSTVAQVKKLKAGDSVSYNRKGVVNQDSLIATIRIGYADGYPRRLGNGVGSVWIKDKLVALIGTVCMDMIMVDISDVPGVNEGDEVILFGEQLPVEQVAAWAGTIPYEIMTGISQRVKRIYYSE